MTARMRRLVCLLSLVPVVLVVLGACSSGGDAAVNSCANVGGTCQSASSCSNQLPYTCPSGVCCQTPDAAAGGG
jgi:hypothetical protein